MTQFISLVHNLVLLKMDNGEIDVESKDALKSVLQEYEIHIKVIEQQLTICQKDHRKLQEEISHLLKENSFLFSQLKTASENKISMAERTLLNDKSMEAIDNLRQQLVLSQDEKQTVEGLWKESLEKVSLLEEKLQDYQSGKQLKMLQNKLKDLQKDYSEAIQILEAQLTTVKKENDQLTLKSHLLENQLMQVTSQMTVITEKNLQLNNTLKEMTDKEQELKSQYSQLETKFNEMDKSYHADKVKFARIYEYERVEDQLKEKLEAALRQRDELKLTVERCQERTVELLRNAASDRSKIEEAVALVEGAILARDEGLAREAACEEELKRLKRELATLVEEAGVRLSQETTAVTQACENQLTTMKNQLQIKEQECLRKSIEVQQLQRECERLRLSSNLTKVTDSQSKRDKQLSKVYNELHYSESECLQLKLENDSLHESFDRIQERYSKASREKAKLKQELLITQQQLQLCQQELSVIVQRADMLNSQLYQTDLELVRLQSESLVIEKDCTCKIEPKISVANTLELYRRLDDSYGQMNNKWKNEMKTLTEEFETKFRKLKERYKNHNFKDTKDETKVNYKSEDHL